MDDQKASKPKRERRFFSAEFKLEAVRRLRDQQATGVSLSQVARELGVGRDMLREWAHPGAARAGAAPEDLVPGPGRLPSGPEELRRLQRENARLAQENEFLKKAAAYFAKVSR